MFAIKKQQFTDILEIDSYILFTPNFNIKI